MKRVFRQDGHSESLGVGGWARPSDQKEGDSVTARTPAADLKVEQILSALKWYKGQECSHTRFDYQEREVLIERRDEIWHAIVRLFSFFKRLCDLKVECNKDPPTSTKAKFTST